MDWKIEVVTIPVSDIDRARDFYSEKVGFEVDIDFKVSDDLRLVQLTRPDPLARSTWERGPWIWNQAPWTACSWSSEMCVPPAPSWWSEA